MLSKPTARTIYPDARSMPKIALPMGRRAQKSGYPQAVQELKQQTRRLLDLPDDATVSISELTCRDPGCPDVETVVAVLREGQKPAIARIHKSILEVRLDELKAALNRSLSSHDLVFRPRTGDPDVDQ